MTIEAMKQALDALEVANSCIDGYYLPKEKAWLPEIEEAIASLRQVIAEAEKKEPVAWMLPGTDSFLTAASKTHHGVRADSYTTPLYTHPPQRTWVGLTPREIYNLWEDSGVPFVDWDSFASIAQAIQAKLKQKNGYAEEKNT